MSMAVRTAIPKLSLAKRAIVLTLMASDKIWVRTNVVTRATYRQLDTSSAGKNGECSVRCLTTSETNDRADIPVAVSTGADPQPDPAPFVIANSDPAIAAPRNTPPGIQRIITAGFIPWKDLDRHVNHEDGEGCYQKKGAPSEHLGQHSTQGRPNGWSTTDGSAQQA